MGKKQRQAATERLAVIPRDEGRVILATGKYIGEGFDDPRLDTFEGGAPECRNLLQSAVEGVWCKLRALFAKKRRGRGSFAAQVVTKVVTASARRGIMLRRSAFRTFPSHALGAEGGFPLRT